MFEDKIKEYESLVKEYKLFVADKFNKQDFVEYNEILFSAHSCGIEGNSYTVDETRTLKEKGLGMIPYGKSLVESFEILDHFRAYEYLLSNLDKPLSEDLLKETHRLLTEHTLQYRTTHDSEPAIPGEYTKSDMSAGDTIFGDHEELIKQVPNLMESTQKALEEGKIHPMILAARFHGFYEYLHPFRDGNGRLGRLFSNFILLKKDLPLIIIEKEHRQEYINALRFIRKERTDEYLVDFFFNQSIERMKYEINNKKNLTNNFLDGMDFYKELSLQNREFLQAAKTNNFTSINNFKAIGYKPSPEVINSLADSGVQQNTIIAIQKLFDLKTEVSELNDIKLAEDKTSETSRNKHTNLSME